MILDKLNEIRTAWEPAVLRTMLFSALAFIGGGALGIFSKWLDELALDSAVWWHVILERLDLTNFFSDLAVWLLAALVIAVCSSSAFRAAWNVFAFFVGMCAAYHLYTVLFAGFNPASYMMIWYGITLVSPFLAVLCWYAGGKGPAAWILDIGIIAVFALACFAIGIFYIDSRGILYLAVFAGAVITLYRSPKQICVCRAAGCALSCPARPLRRSSP